LYTSDGLKFFKEEHSCSIDDKIWKMLDFAEFDDVRVVKSTSANVGCPRYSQKSLHPSVGRRRERRRFKVTSRYNSDQRLVEDPRDWSPIIQKN
jgi:hypothetical protein